PHSRCGTATRLQWHELVSRSCIWRCLHDGDFQRCKAVASGLISFFVKSILNFPRSKMKTVALWTLVAMNVVLLASFTSRMTKSNAAYGETAGSRPGDYLMIP